MRVGQHVRGGTETKTLGVFLGRCLDEAELAAIVARIEDALSYRFGGVEDRSSVLMDPRGLPRQV